MAIESGDTGGKENCGGTRRYCIWWGVSVETEIFVLATENSPKGTRAKHVPLLPLSFH